VTVVLEKGPFERLDSYCRERGFKKSPLLARLVREHLDREGSDQSVPRRGSDPPKASSSRRG